MDGDCVGASFGRKFNLVAGFVAHEGLTNGGLVRNDAEIRGAVPSAKDVEGLLLSVGKTN